MFEKYVQQLNAGMCVIGSRGIDKPGIDILESWNLRQNHRAINGVIKWFNAAQEKHEVNFTSDIPATSIVCCFNHTNDRFDNQNYIDNDNLESSITFNHDIGRSFG